MALERVDGIVVWPSHVKPVSMSYTITHPTSNTRSQAGKKFVRGWDYSAHVLEVTYPPMTAEDFQTFQGAIMSLRGQRFLCWFDLLGTDNEKMLFRYYGDSVYTPAVNTAVDISTG